MLDNTVHIPVLMDEVIENLVVIRGAWYVDATLGGGGHSKAILKRGGNVLSIDRDEDALRRIQPQISELEKTMGSHWIVRKGNFSDLQTIVNQQGLCGRVSGVLFDFGLSSDQLSNSERGFSFQQDGPLDMRMDQSLQVTAADLLNGLTQAELQKLFQVFGEASHSKTIARAIVEQRGEQPLRTTTEFASLVDRVVPVDHRKGKKSNPATQYFQALRIAVNNELEEISIGLDQAYEVLSKDGRILTISFHSLEDRIVKQFIQNRDGLSPVTKKPILPTEIEVKNNLRSRSAKLRVAEKH